MSELLKFVGTIDGLPMTMKFNSPEDAERERELFKGIEVKTSNMWPPKETQEYKECLIDEAGVATIIEN